MAAMPNCVRCGHAFVLHRKPRHKRRGDAWCSCPGYLDRWPD